MAIYWAPLIVDSGAQTLPNIVLGALCENGFLVVEINLR